MKGRLKGQPDYYLARVSYRRNIYLSGKKNHNYWPRVHIYSVKKKSSHLSFGCFPRIWSWPGIIFLQTSFHATILEQPHGTVVEASAQASSNETKEEDKRKQCKKRQIDEDDDEPQPMRPPDNSHHDLTTLKRHIPRYTFKKGCDDVVARTGRRVSW
jgi:hypothetical protein